jgi:hypothetical protein
MSLKSNPSPDHSPKSNPTFPMTCPYPLSLHVQSSYFTQHLPKPFPFPEYTQSPLIAALSTRLHM